MNLRNSVGQHLVNNPQICSLVTLCAPISPSCQVIRACMKDLLIPRYKIVVLVHIGQLSGQSMQVSSRCLWDASSDTSASHVIKNSSLFGLASVYAVYYEWTPPGAHHYIWSVFYSWKEKKVVQVCSIFFNFFPHKVITLSLSIVPNEQIIWRSSRAWRGHSFDSLDHSTLTSAPVFGLAIGGPLLAQLLLSALDMCYLPKRF